MQFQLCQSPFLPKPGPPQAPCSGDRDFYPKYNLAPWWLYDCAILAAVLPPSMPPTGPVSKGLGWRQECFVWLGLVLDTLECL